MRLDFKNLKKNKGSAIVWAVCALLVLSLVAIALLAASSSYYDRAVREVTLEKAEMLAVSGIEYTKTKLALKEAGTYISPDTIYDNTAEQITKRIYLDGNYSSSSKEEGIKDKNRTTNYVDLFLVPVKNNPDKTKGEYAYLRVTAIAYTGDDQVEVHALFRSSGTTAYLEEVWEFYGYTE